MSTHELSPESMNRNQGAYQRQRSVSDDIEPMVNQCHLDDGTSTVAFDRQRSSDESPHYEKMSCVAEDAKRRVCDAVESTGNVVQGACMKGMTHLAKNIEKVVPSPKDIVDLTTRHIPDGCGRIVNASVGLVDRAFQQQHSIEEKPDNNVHISHPSKGTAQMIPMGLHIQPETSMHFSGQKVLMVEPGQLAEQASLKENDVIIAMDETDITKLPLTEVLEIFATISSNFSMTVIRLTTKAIFTQHIIAVKVHVNEDNAVALEVLNVKCSTTSYSYRADFSPPCNFYISNKRASNAQRQYMRVVNDRLTMHGQADEDQSCFFKLNVYESQCQSVGAITLQNSNKAVCIEEGDNEDHVVGLGNIAGLTNRDIPVDSRFFLQHFPELDNQCVRCFESLENSTGGKFLSVDGNDLKFESVQYSDSGDLSSIDTRFKFTLSLASNPNPDSDSDSD